MKASLVGGALTSTGFQKSKTPFGGKSAFNRRSFGNLTRNSLTMVSSVFRDRTQSITYDTPGGEESLLQSNFAVEEKRPTAVMSMPDPRPEPSRLQMPFALIDEESLNLSCPKISEKSPSMEISLVLDQSYIK